MRSIQKIELDFAGESIPKKVFAKQGDAETRFLEITPLCHGQILQKEEGIVPRLRLCKPDGHTVMNDGSFTEGKITVELTRQALSCAGKAVAEIGLYKGTELLSSQMFIVEVRPTAYPEGAPESSDEYGSLTKTLAEAEKAIKNAKEALEEAQIAVEVANTAKEAMESTLQAAGEAGQSAESAMKSAEDAKGSAEEAMKSAEDAKDSANAAKAAAEAAFRDMGEPEKSADEITVPGIYAGTKIEGAPGKMGTLVVFSSAGQEAWTAQLFFVWDKQEMYFRIFDPVHETKGHWTKVG